MTHLLLDIHLFGVGVDAPLIIQELCIALSTVLLLGIGARGKFDALRFCLETAALTLAFFLLNLISGAVSMAANVFFGSYLHYLLGIVLFAVFFGVHGPLTRVVMASVVFSVSVMMASFGTLLGNAIEVSVAGFDIAWTKIGASFFTVLFAAIYYRWPLFRFRISGFDASLNIVSNLLSALLFVILEFCQRYGNFAFGLILQFSGYLSLSIIFVFVINVMTYFMTYFLCRERERIMNYQMERQKSRSLHDLLALSEQKLIELREVRHDVKNQYAYMQTMLESKRYDELKDYFKELVGTFSKPLYDAVESGNAIVDSVLNMERSKAREAGLKLEVRAAVPACLPFPQSAILGLFGNVIDNAVEACEREGFQGASVEIVVGMQGNYMFFNVSNPTRKTYVTTDGGHSEKKDKVLHGYGMRIIHKIVKKYNGYYRCFVRDGKYVFESLLDTTCPAALAEGAASVKDKEE